MSCFSYKTSGFSKQIGSDILISLQLHKPHCICVRLWILPLTSNIKCNITIIFTSNCRLENVTGQVLWRILRFQLSRVSIFSFLFLFVYFFKITFLGFSKAILILIALNYPIVVKLNVKKRSRWLTWLPSSNTQTNSKYCLCRSTPPFCQLYFFLIPYKEMSFKEGWMIFSVIPAARVTSWFKSKIESKKKWMR